MSALDDLAPPDDASLYRDKVIRRTAATEEEAAAIAKKLSGQPFSIQGPAVSILDDLPPPPAAPSTLDSVKQGAGNVVAGAVRGAGSIGATILYPWDKAQDLIAGDRQQGLSRNEERRQAMDDALTTMGADPNSIAYQTGKLGAEVAGTAATGGILGAGAKAVGMAPEVVAALSSGGMSLGRGTTGTALGNAALRGTAGAIGGAVTAGMVDPSTAGTGAAIGAATPGAAWLAGVTGRAISNVAGGVTKSVLGGTTGTGSSVIDAAYKAGLKGDKSFVDNMRGHTNFSDIVDQAKDALTAMREARGQAYRTGMAAVSGDKTVLNVQPVLNSIRSAQEKFAAYHGEVINENAHSAIQRVQEKVNDWAAKDPAIFHTPEGLDKLKQWVGGELENAKPGTQTDAALKGIYNSIKSTIAAQAPTYAKTMSAYETASEQLSEISRTLSLNPRASIDTSVRKLQSVLRDNVNTNFGNRAGNVKALQDQGGANLVSAIAGQSMRSAWPRGVAGIADAAMLAPAVMHNPMMLAGAVAASPRLVGEATYGAGRVMGGARSALIPNSGYLPLNRFTPLLGSQSGLVPLNDFNQLRR